MNSFTYARATDTAGAVREVSAPNAKFLAGGTNLVDLMKMGVQRPDRLVDINRLDLKKIEKTGDLVRLGALVTNAAAAVDGTIKTEFPVLSSAILAGASPQLRNMATTGGNLLQRTRCYYFMDTASRCNKREPGSGCSAIEGINRIHAILGASASCVATHPSDMCVALAALDATVRVEGSKGARAIAMADFHRLPGDTPHVDTTLAPDELVVAVEIPTSALARRSRYVKVRDRAQYAFALVSVAAALETDGDKISGARIALGGVAHKPWRATEAEALLVGEKPDAKAFAAAAEAAVRGAKPLAHNAFKVELAKRAIARALADLADGKIGGVA